MMFRTTVAALSAAASVAAVTTMEVQGSRFVNPKTNEEFQIVGMAYQIGGSAGYQPSKGIDPLSDGAVCLRDAALGQMLGVNTIRVYNLDPDLNHDACASIFNAAGIYMLIDVNSPLVGESLNSDEPWTTYTQPYLNRTFAIVENFKNYDNLLGFFSGNEVINNIKNGAQAPPYVRAVTRDLKNYIKNNADRKIPVGYSAADVRDVLADSYNYFTCSIASETDDESRADMFALNSYSWCGDSDFQKAGYDQLVNIFNSTSVPVYFSEFGCNTPAPRIFTEIQAIYDSEMTDVFSGGVIYEYGQEKNNYGLASVNDDQSLDLLADFRTLQNQYNKVDWKSVQSVKYVSKASAAVPACKSSLITEKGFNNNFTLPTLLPGVQTWIDNGIPKKLNGKIIDISDWKVSQTVKDSDGSTLSGLAVKALSSDESNTPGSTDTGSGGDSSTTDNASPRLAPMGSGTGFIFAIPAILATFFAIGITLV